LLFFHVQITCGGDLNTYSDVISGLSQSLFISGKSIFTGFSSDKGIKIIPEKWFELANT